MLIIVAALKAQPGKEEALINLFLKVIPETRKEPGNLRYDLFRSVSDASSFLAHEEYVDYAALEAHRATGHLKAAIAVLGGLLAEPATVRRFEEPKS